MPDPRIMTSNSLPISTPKSRLIAAAWSLIAGRILLSLALLTACVVMVAWLAGFVELRSLINGLPTMKFNTALGLGVLSVVGLIRSQMRYTKAHWDWLAIGLATFVFGLATISLLEIAFSWNLGIDTLFSADPNSVSLGKPPGRMSTGTAIALWLLAFSQLISDYFPTWVRKSFAFIAGLLGLISILLFLFRNNARGTSIFSTTAIHTAALLFLIAAGFFLIWRGTKFIQSANDRTIVLAELHRARPVSSVVIGMLALALLVTGSLVVDAQRTIRQTNETRFNYFTNLAVEDIERNINRVVYGLRGIRGLYFGSEQVSRNEFAEFVFSRDLSQEFPGAIGFGLIERVERIDLDKFIETVRQDSAPDFQINTQGNAPDLLVIKIIFPLEQNRNAWGYDIGSEITRRRAAEKAVRTGRPTITGRIELVQDERKTSGFLYFLPIYNSNELPPTPEEREKELRGLIYAPIILEQAISDVDSRTQSYVQIVIYDTDDRNNDVLLYGNPKEAMAERKFTQQIEISPGDRKWRIDTYSTPAFENQIDRVTPSMIGIGGMTLSLLLAGVIWMMGRNIALGHNQAVELQVSEEIAREARRTSEKANLAKSEFLANMSHEIRTPMNAIIGLTDTVLRTELTTDQRDYLRTVSESSNILLQIINDILDFSKIEAGKLELDEDEFQLHDLIAKLLKSLSPRLHDRDIEIVYHVDRNVPPLLIGDSRRIGQILLNLVGNSIKFTQQGIIEVKVIPLQPQVKQANEVQLKFAVRDTGIGIPQEKLASIFNVFEQADSSITRRYGGTGLGLTISSLLVHKLGGEIWVESEQGVGSTFFFTVNLRVAKDQSPLPWRDAAHELVGKRALVVDDNEIDQLMLKEVTESYNLQAQTANSGASALQYLKAAVQDNHPFDIVITDVKMPEMDGYEMIQQLQANPEQYGRPVVILVSSGGINSHDRDNSLQIASRIRKPIKPSELLEAIVDGFGLGSTEVAILPQDEPESVDATRTRLHILVAEDSPANQKVAMAILKRRHHKITVVQNGLEALATVQKNKFDVVLMDVQMPEMDGLTAAFQIREHEQESGGHIPIVATTAHALKKDRERCLSAGMDEYVSKPLSPDELFAAIDNAICKSQNIANSLESRKPSREPTLPVSPATKESLVPWEKLLQRLGNDHETLTEIVEAYIPEMNKSIANIQTAIANNDGHLLTISAHKLKSALRFFHQIETAKIAESLEQSGVRNEFASTADNAQELAQRLSVLMPTLVGFNRE
ncbi:response regulator [Bremerella cremea]|uniref:Sensory/regulatory protein RpfC n=1 Tax=Bremerella cremea TaxID=1031537 RepID=A0A368KPI8_9BACT|nr:CHASE domain-containing protein [Bremerella cremea]RCS46452.1 response regulator [Bremerella cremea]